MISPAFAPLVLVLGLAGCAQILGIDERQPSGDGATPITGNRCEGVPDTCGPTGNESCCTAFGVPGGTFDREHDSMFRATVSDYVLDKYLVTVGRFRKFVEAGYGNQMMPPPPGAGEHPNLPGSGWDATWSERLAPSPGLLKLGMRSGGCGTGSMWSDDPADKEHRPINCTSWLAAMAFCIWDGGYLPTFAEWQYAAAGGNLKRMYPWGATAPDATFATFNTTEPADVGSTPNGNGRFGHADLTGNLTEVVLDFAPRVNLPVPCNDCALIEGDPRLETRQMVHASYLSPAAQLTVAGVNGGGIGDNGGARNIGFRCARPVN